MRKNLALAMVALLAMTLALAAVGCAQKQAAEEPAPPVTADTTSMTQDSMPVDTAVQQ